MVTVMAQRAAARPGRGSGADPLTGVWSIDLGDPRWDVPALATLLTPAERRRAAGGVDHVRRRRTIVRAGLRQLLAGVLGCLPADVPIDIDGGRPVIAGSGIEVSCSAHGDVALIALAHGPVGIDVAGAVDEDLTTARAEGWLSDEEERLVRALAPSRRAAALGRCWAQKEAVLKAEGIGLLRHPATVLTPGAASGSSGRWWLADVAVPEGHVAALATSSPPAVAAAPLQPVPMTPDPRGARS